MKRNLTRFAIPAAVRILARASLLAAPLALHLAAPPAARAQDGFLFGVPKAQFTLRAGPVLHNAGGDLMGFFMDSLTLDRGDFRAPSIAGEIALFVHPRVDIAVGASYSKTKTGSEFRFWEQDDDVGSPITQTTSLRVAPLTASFRFYPLSRGRSISGLAWVPTRTTPYVGAAAGIAWYRLEQAGDFMDSEDLVIFTSEFETDGSATIGQIIAGVDHWISPRFGLNADARYTFGGATPSDDYFGWNSLDLSGIQLALGLVLRY